MKPTTVPSVRIAIIDSKPQDYAALLAALGTPGVSVHFLLSGNDALRFAKQYPSGLWVINTQLPDVSGFDLAQMLRSIRPSALVFMIGDEYCLDDEMQTLTLGLAKYLCKPLEPAWVLPHSEVFCIPLPNYRGSSRSFSLVAPAENHLAEGLPEPEGLPGAVALTGGGPEEEDEQVILPFEPKPGRRRGFRQRPAA